MAGIKKWAAIGVAIVVVTVAVVAALVLYRGGSDANQINVYFFNQIERQMEAEVRPLPEGEFQIYDIIMYLHAGPRTGGLDTTWPLELAPQPEDLISAVKLQDTTLYVFLTPVFHEMSPINQSLFKAAFIHTLGEAPLVSDIKLLVTENYNYAFEAIMRGLDDDGQNNDNDEDYTPYVPLIIYDSNHAGILINPLDPPISPQWMANRTFNNLHFVDATGTGLVVESYFAEDINMQPRRLAEYMLDLLIAGPRQEGAVSLVPPETSVLRIETDGSDIYVNLSSDFFTRFVGSRRDAHLMIYSIVNTLTAELAQTRVFFLIETQQVEQFHGVEDFNTEFTRDNTWLLSYIEALALEDESDEYETEEETE
ncbi:MAG: GerMN domain-containing protein [Defluviitaleaceae bacterium]|nr:GerMN domain-containing protein [Defluviitaleaceae bacterium]